MHEVCLVRARTEHITPNCSFNCTVFYFILLTPSPLPTPLSESLFLRSYSPPPSSFASQPFYMAENGDFLVMELLLHMDELSAEDTSHTVHESSEASD